MEKSPSSKSEIQEIEILALQIEQSYRQQPTAILVSGLNGVFVASVLWNAIQTSQLLIWFCALVLVTLARLGLVIAYQTPRFHRSNDTADWSRYFLIGALASGLVWGLAGALLFPEDSFPHQVFLAFALGGMIAGAMPLLSALTPAFQLFAIPAGIPIILRMLSGGDQMHLTMGIMMIIFTLAMTAASSRFHNLTRESIELRIRLTHSIEEKLALNTIARMDPLTGVGNRRLFDEALDSEWKRALRVKGSLSLIMADIDYFKRYNDRLGHPEGDACLTRVAQTMAKIAKRPGDLIARLGGEEFGVLLPGTPAEDALELAEQLRQMIEELEIPHPDSPIADQVTISLGVAELMPDPGLVPADLIEAADTALYAAKHQGRNCVVQMF